MSEPFGIDSAIKFFFDAEAVEKATNRMERRALSKIGSWIRTRARSLMRPAGKKGKVSRPGEPPRTRIGSLKKFLFFVFVMATRSVVVGPAAFARRSKASPNPVPALLEAGGQMVFNLVELSGGLVVPAASKLGRSSTGQKFKDPRVMEPRPYMHPAYEAEFPKFAGSFAGEFSSNGG